jgi:hypothetical protein
MLCITPTIACFQLLLRCCSLCRKAQIHLQQQLQQHQLTMAAVNVKQMQACGLACGTRKLSTDQTCHTARWT